MHVHMQYEDVCLLFSTHEQDLCVLHVCNKIYVMHEIFMISILLDIIDTYVYSYTVLFYAYEIMKIIFVNVFYYWSYG